MKWKEVLTEAMDRTPVMLATATTGLDDDDELIAVAIRVMAMPGRDIEWPQNRLIVRSVDRDKLLKAQPYHQISPEYMTNNALEDEEFNATLAQWLDNYEAFTYNPPFQVKYITGQLTNPPARMPHDLPLLMKYANMHLVLDGETTESVDTLETAAAQMAGRGQSFKKLCSTYALAPLLPPALPLESSVDQLASLWERLCLVDCEVQQTLL